MSVNVFALLHWYQFFSFWLAGRMWFPSLWMNKAPLLNSCFLWTEPGTLPNLPSLSSNFTTGSSAEGHVKFYFQPRETFHLASHLQLQLIDFIVLMVINAADCPSESHDCDCLSLHARSGGIPCFSSLSLIVHLGDTFWGVIQWFMNQSPLNPWWTVFRFSWSSVANWIVRQTEHLNYQLDGTNTIFVVVFFLLC